jgi:hypothetical protein
MLTALYEQGRVHHVGALPELEDQLCLWDATSTDVSPDRLDALVWAITELALDGQPPLELLSGHAGSSSSNSVDPREGFRVSLRDVLTAHRKPPQET